MACIPRTQRPIKTLIILCLLVTTYLTGIAQDDELISADTVDRLQSVQRIDYGEFDADLEIGWFIMNPTATEFVVFDNQQTLHRVVEDDIVESWQYVTDDEQVFSVIDGVYFDDRFYILYTIDNVFWINDSQLSIEGIPLALGADDDYLYVEAQVDTELVVNRLNEEFDVIDMMTIPSDDDEPVIRVGRIPLPIILQTTFDGYVTAYDFDELVGEYEVDNGPTVFGHINALTSHFAWSDPNSTTLNLLDLVTGENEEVAELDNLYAQYYLLSQDASLVIAINVDFQLNVVAWATQTGERFELGEYRHCERIPDKVQLSADGTTLVIGCDTGLDLWRLTDMTEKE